MKKAFLHSSCSALAIKKFLKIPAEEFHFSKVIVLHPSTLPKMFHSQKLSGRNAKNILKREYQKNKMILLYPLQYSAHAVFPLVDISWSWLPVRELDLVFEEFSIYWGKEEIPATPLPPLETLDLCKAWLMELIHEPFHLSYLSSEVC